MNHDIPTLLNTLEESFKKAQVALKNEEYATIIELLLPYTSLVDMPQVTAPILYLLGISYKKCHNPQEASRLLEKSLRLEPKNIDAYKQLAYLYSEHKQLERANTLLLKGLKECGNADSLLNGLVNIAFDSGTMSEAKQYLDIQLSENPNNPIAHANLGKYYQRTGNQIHAIKNYKKAVEALPCDEAVITNFLLSCNNQRLDKRELFELHKKLVKPIKPIVNLPKPEWNHNKIYR